MPQFGPPLWALLSLPQLAEQPLIVRNRHAPSLRTAGAPRSRRAGCTDLRREVDHAPQLEGNRHLVRTANGPGFPIQGKGRLGETVSVAYRPGFAVDGLPGWTLPDQRAAQIPAVDVKFDQCDR